MGICLEIKDFHLLSADKICKTINEYFAGLAVRNTNIDNFINIVKRKILTKNQYESNDLISTLEEELTNNKFLIASKNIINKARDVAKYDYNDDTLPYQSLLLLAISDLDKFINAFKVATLFSQGNSLINQMFDYGNNRYGNNLYNGINQGIGFIKGISDLTQQVADTNIIKKDNLINFLKFHINFITLLPLEFLKETSDTTNSRVAMTIQYVLENAFSKKQQQEYINYIFSNYNSEQINVDDFFKDNYSYLKDDKTLRINLVKHFIGNMRPRELINAATDFYKTYGRKNKNINYTYDEYDEEYIKSY